jgi:NitT/TauT family transport system substrate-binding protein
MNARSLRALSLIAVILALAAGCTTAAGTAAPSNPQKTDVTVAALPAVDLAGLYIALNDGLFARQGLHVTIKPIASSQAIITGQLAGQVDIGAGAYVPYISAQAAGDRFRILAAADTLGANARELVTAADSPLTTVSELAGKKIGVNGTNSIGTLLISMLLSEHGVSPKKVWFITDKQGFPDMTGQLQDGAWDAAFLAEPYISAAAMQYGDQVLADLDQGGAVNFPIDGYVATQAWTEQHPKTAAAFVRAIEAGQAIANSDPPVVRAVMARDDKLPPPVTAAMALPGFPVGALNETALQGVAQEMLQVGMLGKGYSNK